MMPKKTAIPRATAVLVLVIGLGPLARAQPARPAADDPANASEATRLYDEGKRHFDIGEYAQAIVSWKQSYLRSSAPLLLFNIAQAYRLSNNCAQANRFYLNYRRSEPHPKNQAELDKAMARCTGVEPATGDAATSEPPTSPAAPTTGTPTAEAPRPATPPATTPPAAAASAASPPAAVSLPTAGADHPTAPSSHRGGGWRTAGLVTGGAGAAALVASAVYAIKARQDSNTVSGAPVGTPYADVAAADRSGMTAASRAQALLGIGAVLAAAGSVMWVVGHRQGQAQVDLAIIPGHTEVTFSCAF
jgi:hypothetical protein